MSSVKPLCKSTELNRCIATDRRWKRKQASCSSPERLPNLRPSSLSNSKDEQRKAPNYYFFGPLLLLLLLWLSQNVTTWTVSKLLTTTNFDLMICGSISKASNSLPTSKLPIISSSPSTKHNSQYTVNLYYNIVSTTYWMTTVYDEASKWHSAVNSMIKVIFYLLT